MTCLVALRHSRGVILGADSAACTDDTIETTRKVFRAGRVWLAFAGAFDSFDRVLVDAQRAPAPGRDLRDWVAEHCAWCHSVSGFALSGAQCVVWESGGASDVVTYSSVGSAAGVALGAFHATIGEPAQARVLAALRAAVAHGDGVRPPFILIQRGRERTVRE